MNDQAQKPVLNVAEPWILFDTLKISSLYTDKKKLGWFPTFAAFAAQEQHSFFKLRTEASVGLAYCNLQSTDSLDYRIDAYSFGMSFFAPLQYTGVHPGGTGQFAEIDHGLHGAFFTMDLPRHCGVQLKVQQDIIFEGTCYLAQPGYGPLYSGGGAAFATGGLEMDHMPYLVGSASQGLSVISNRWRFPRPINIPRTATIEAVLWLGDYARFVLSNMLGPWSYIIQDSIVSPPPSLHNYPTACGIQASILGKRWVQQRGQYHV